MMIFFTVLFLTLYCISLGKGRLFNSFIIEASEESIKQQKVGKDSYKASDEFVGKSCLYLLFSMFYLISLFSYYCVAIKYDPLKYPTLILLSYLIASLTIAFAKEKKKTDLSTEEKVEAYRKKKSKTRTVSGTVGQLLSISYFTYMLIQLAF